MTGEEYFKSCPHHEKCVDCICSPWGIYNPEAVGNERKILLVGINAHDGKEPQDAVRTKKEYSDGLKELMRREIATNGLKNLSNIAPALARFLGVSRMVDVMDQINLCNMVLCAHKHNDSSEPSAVMRANCLKRLRSDSTHELIRRVVNCRPTHVLVLSRDRDLWSRAIEQPSALVDALTEHAPPARVAFCHHPSRGWLRDFKTRDEYCEFVVQELQTATSVLEKFGT